MTDQSLRELERRFQETGALADEAAFLLARTRAGDLGRSNLEIAAHVGHRAAQEAAGLTPGSDDVQAWIRDLGAWGSEAPVRAAIEAARLAVSRWTVYRPLQVRLRQALGVVEQWALLPSSVLAAQAHEEAVGLMDAYLAPAEDGALGAPEQVQGVCWCVHHTAAAASHADTPEAAAFLAARAVDNAVQFTGDEAAIRDVISISLSTWALGRGDGVRNRVNEPRAEVDWEVDRVLGYVTESLLAGETQVAVPAPPPSWSRILIFEVNDTTARYNPSQGQRCRVPRSALRTPQEFAPRFEEILDQGTGDWVNFNAYGILEDALLISVEFGQSCEPGTVPRDHIFVNLSGPYLETGWNTAAHTEIVD